MAYDVSIVGGGFGGLSAAMTLYKHGMDVCIIEKNEQIGSPIRTTGLLPKDIVDNFPIPKKFLNNGYKGLIIHSPSGKEYEIAFNKDLIYSTKTSELLGWMAKNCEDHGVDVITGERCRNIEIGKKVVVNNSIISKAAIVSSGPDTRLVKSLTGDCVNSFLVGMEYLIGGDFSNKDGYMEIFMDNELAPGYGAWILPDSEITHIGMCRNQKINNDIRKELMSYFKHRIDPNADIIEMRVGVVPASGPIKRTYGNKFLVVGDAAGQTGAATCEGIRFAMEIGGIAAQTIYENIDNPSSGSLSVYEKRWKSVHYRNLMQQVLIRDILDNLDSNENIEIILSLLDNPKYAESAAKAIEYVDTSKLDILRAAVAMTKHPKLAVKLASYMIKSRLL